MLFFRLIRTLRPVNTATTNISIAELRHPTNTPGWGFAIIEMVVEEEGADKAEEREMSSGQNIRIKSSEGGGPIRSFRVVAVVLVLIYFRFELAIWANHVN